YARTRVSRSKLDGAAPSRASCGRRGRLWTALACWSTTDSAVDPLCGGILVAIPSRFHPAVDHRRREGATGSRGGAGGGGETRGQQQRQGRAERDTGGWQTHDVPPKSSRSREAS